MQHLRKLPSLFQWELKIVAGDHKKEENTETE